MVVYLSGRAMAQGLPSPRSSRALRLPRLTTVPLPMKHYYQTFSKCSVHSATILQCHMATCAYDSPLPQFNVTLLIQLACYNLSLVGGQPGRRLAFKSLSLKAWFKDESEPTWDFRDRAPSGIRLGYRPSASGDLGERFCATLGTAVDCSRFEMYKSSFDIDYANLARDEWKKETLDRQNIST